MLSEQDRFNLVDLSRFKRFLLEFTATSVLHGEQTKYLDEYSCKKRPPLFMALVSLVEVSAGSASGDLLYIFCQLTNDCMLSHHVIKYLWCCKL